MLGSCVGDDLVSSSRVNAHQASNWMEPERLVLEQVMFDGEGEYALERREVLVR